MSDLAFGLLQKKINSQSANVQSCLWLVDENINASDIASVANATSLSVLCNRYDVYLSLKKNGFNVLLNDFDFSSKSRHSVDCLFYRISKEKAIVHHIINSAARYLKEGGKLFISGFKNEGIKTYVKKASEYLGECLDSERAGKSSLLAVIEYQASKPVLSLDDKHYSELRLINPGDKVTFMSKPGVFGWNKIDQGSSFLVHNLPRFLQHKTPLPCRIADLGCGYGYLSIMAAQLLNAEFIAVDNNVAAVNACQENFKQQGIRGSVVLSDCAGNISQLVDVVLCNPPFHQGFSIESDLALKFLLACKRLLVPGGLALFVVNSFIDLERKAATLFSDVSVLEKNKQFKLVLLKK